MAVGEWDERQLCADGACVGVIGPDGTCKVCGRAAPNWGDERTRGLNTADGDDEDDDEDDDDLADGDDDGDDDEEYEDDDEEYEDDEDDQEEDNGEDRVSVASAGPAPGWTERQLCPDGACIGVIGADGRCKVCGRATAGDAASTTASPSHASEATSEAGAALASRSCSDAACTGVSGSDGRCTECGKLVA